MRHKKGHTAVFGIYSLTSGAHDAVDRLKIAGFRNEDISVLMPTKGGTADFAHEKSTKAPEGVATGAASGAIVGGGLGWLVGIGALAIPGIGPFVAAGPIMSALAGMGVGGAVGGITGALVGMGIPEFEAKRYEGFVKEGGILLSVHVDDADWAIRAKQILKVSGARDISAAGEVRSNEKFEPNFVSDSRTETKPGLRPADPNQTETTHPYTNADNLRLRK